MHRKQKQMEMETQQFITADWLREQGFEETDFDNRHFRKIINERTCNLHQNRISGAWTIAVFDTELRRQFNMFNYAYSGIRYQGELMRMAKTFFN